jgi:branched-chain amino acid aminotransferase
VTKVNGLEIGRNGQVWGPVTKRIADAYRRFVDYDFVSQYLKRYTDGMHSRAF